MVVGARGSDEDGVGRGGQESTAKYIFLTHAVFLLQFNDCKSPDEHAANIDPHVALWLDSRSYDKKPNCVRPLDLS